MVPFADMINHNTPPQSLFQKLDTAANGEFSVKALQDIHKGEEITISYGMLSN